jgi:hypothetical protein
MNRAPMKSIKLLNRHAFRRRVLRTGMILATVRLGVIWLWVLLDRTGHGDLGFVPLFILCALIFFPEGLLLDYWIRTPTALSGLVILTSFFVAAGWALITRSDMLIKSDDAGVTAPP